MVKQKVGRDVYLIIESRFRGMKMINQPLTVSDLGRLILKAPTIIRSSRLNSHDKRQ